MGCVMIRADHANMRVCMIAREPQWSETRKTVFAK
jgi:hypothetical protein